MNELAVTLDIDWAPDFAIDFTAGLLKAARVPATWFVTHVSPAVDRLRAHPDIFELGLHPNFLPGSTHGASPEEVLDHCQALVPEARSIRTHCLVSSTPLLDLMITRAGLKTDVSLFAPRTPGLRPFEYYWRGQSFWRVPFFWEDDFEMERGSPCWTLDEYLELGAGLQVFNFHPIHVCLNSADMAPYGRLKQQAPQLAEASEETITGFVNPGVGTRSLFCALVDHLGRAGGAKTIDALVADFKCADHQSGEGDHAIK
jgi:hypothetical protein